MAIYDDVKITINLNELVEIRAKLLTQNIDYSQAIASGEYLDANDIDKLATQLRETLTWDTLYYMIDGAILDYLGLQDPKRPHYGETSIESIDVTMEKEKKEREKEFKKNFDMVDLHGGSWTIQVPMRKTNA